MKTSLHLRPAWLLVIVLLLAAGPARPQQQAMLRRIVSLDGTWQIAQGSMDRPSEPFRRTVPVPGLADMAEPAFEQVGFKSEKRQAFWYRRTFRLEQPLSPVAMLKINKAKYGTKVWLNGQVVGEHIGCFTPAWFDVTGLLKEPPAENELLVRLGADRSALPETVPTGWDFEKYRYIPGIYDSVQLILTGRPYIASVQTAPQPSRQQLRVRAELQQTADHQQLHLAYRITTASTGQLFQQGQITIENPDKKNNLVADFTIPMPNARLWSPEQPFLYNLELTTVGDSIQVRFGMRSFAFDRIRGRAILNGRVYFLRGTNICIFRFFEDAQRGDKPWRKDWVRLLGQRFKSMHFNAIRYCIGPPPEFWYDIADEQGFLIQDEFPIWLLSRAPENPRSDQIAAQYAEWIRQHANHPCVVIWDAQNESVTDQTGKAIAQVRHLDLSNRPWENGWAEPASPADCVEAHPYLFIRAWSGRQPFRFHQIAELSGTPPLRQAQKKYNVPIIINEYGWLWLNRDGSPTILTKKVYESLFPAGSTVEQRRELYARYLAALTEFWRAHRACAGVLHFYGLGYSRPGLEPRPKGGATSDHFIDLEKLTFEPNFERYMRDAFSPVGLMLDFWDEQLTGPAQRTIQIYLINDLYESWTGRVQLKLLRAGQLQTSQSKLCTVPPLGRQIVPLEQSFPDQPGHYELRAELIGQGRSVRSIRRFEIKGAD